MKIICPNTNLPEWKKLEDKIGKERAYLAYFRDNHGIPAPNQRIPSIDRARELLGIPKPVESLEGYKTTLPEKSSVTTMIKDGQAYVETRQGHVSNGHWMILKDDLPKALGERIKRLREKNQLADRLQGKPPDANDVLQKDRRKYETPKHIFTYSGEAYSGYEWAVFSTNDGRLNGFDVNYYTYLRDNIKGFSMKISGEERGPAIIYSGNKEIGALMPASIRELEGVQVGDGVIKDGRIVKGGAKVPQMTSEEKAAALALTKDRSAVLPEQKKESTPSRQVSDWAKDKLSKQETISREDLLKQAAEAYGGKISEGKYTAKDAFDAMEVAVNEYISDMQDKTLTAFDPYGADVKKAKSDIDLIRSRIMERIPSQAGIRTPEQQEYQQFSTPPDLAYTMAWAANIGDKDTILEPSAGTGSLAVFGKMHAKTIVNELSSRRAELLKGMGFDQVFEENAEQLNNVLPKDVRPTVVLMNPPFSATAGRIPGQRQSANVVTHLDQALKRLEDGGRLVALIGKGWFDDPKAVSSFLKNLVDNYNLRANITVAGKGYAKYSTTYDNRILVVDKTEPEGQPTVEATVQDVKDAIPLLQEVRDARRFTEPRPAESDVKAVPSRPEGVARPEPTVLPPTHELGTGQRKGEGEGQPIKADIGEPPGGESPGRLPVSEAGGGRGRIPGGAKPQPVQGPGGPSVGAPGYPGLEGQPPLEGELSPAETTALNLEQIKEEEHPTDISDSLYENYKPKKAVIKGSKPHPGPIVESAAMASVDPPEAKYIPRISKEIIDSGKLSNVQLESIIYTGQAHQEVLPSGERMGFFIGDGTGVGKGREIAGILLDNWNQGRKKAIWLSQNSPLIEDAKRDVKGVGWRPDLVFDVGKIKIGSPIKNAEGIAFLGYDLLRSQKKSQPTPERKEREVLASRLQQVIDWFGKDYDGVLIFDESHNLGNALEVRGKRGKRKPSEKALRGLELQQFLPNARVVYVSATGATEVMNLAYARRLGLWGQGTSFADAPDFINKMTAGGIGNMELVARDMKAMGKYTARSLSYDGVEYSRLPHKLTPPQRESYDTLAEAWQVVLNHIDKALDVSGVTQTNPDTGRKKTINGQAKSAAMSAFWGAHQRFFNQIITAMQMPTVIKHMEEQIAEGNACIIQLVNTNEAQTKRALSRMEEEDELEDLDITPREQLMQYIQNSFPVTQYQQTIDQNGNIISVPVKDSKGNFVQNEEAVRMREQLLNHLGGIKVPDNPLDMVINHFGSNKVAEVTGRTQRVVNVTDEKGTHRAIERRSKAKAMADADSFMNDKKQILAFSYAGGTGRSYHADLAAKNQRPRVHYVVQPGWRADRAIQGMGRSHRTNQAHNPEYLLAEIDELKGQKRFVSSIARRLEQIGALTRGQRQTGGQGLFSERDNLESVYAENALERLIMDVAYGRVVDLGVGEFSQQLGLNLLDADGNLNESKFPDIPQFLNRLLSLKIDMQNKVFDLFSDRLDMEIAKAIEEGTFDTGLQTLRAKKIDKLGEQVVHTDQETGAETKFVELELTKDPDIIPWGKAGRVARGGFVKNIRSGRIWALSEPVLKTSVHTGEVINTYKATGINYGMHSLEEGEINDPEKYIKLGRDEAEALWRKEYYDFPKEIKERAYLVTGAILPVYNRLPGQNARTVRLQTSSGERLLGRLISPEELDATKERLGAETKQIEMGPGEIIENVFHHNYKIELANDWKIVRRKVMDEDRIELLGLEWREAEQFKKKGLIEERVQWQTRYFVPNSEKGIDVIEAILDNNPIVKATPGKVAAEDLVAAHAEGFKPKFSIEEKEKPLGKEKEDVDEYKDEEWPDYFLRKLSTGRSEVQRILNEGVGEGFNPEDIRIPTKLTTRQQRVLAKAESVAHDVIFFDGINTVSEYSGFVSPDRIGRIYINSNHPDPDVVFRHELMHSLALIYPREFKELCDSLSKEFQNIEQFKAEINAIRKRLKRGPLTDTEVQDELLSHLLAGEKYEHVKNPETVKREIEQFLKRTTNITDYLKSEKGAISLDLLTPGLQSAIDMEKGIATLVAPTTKSKEHFDAAKVLGAKLGTMHRDAEASANSLRKDSRAFDKMGVHNPKTPLDQNAGIKFMSDMSQGRPMYPDLQKVADKINTLFVDRLKKLTEAGAPLQTVRENYFPGMWTKDSRNAFNQAMGEAIDQGIGGGGDPVDWSPKDKKWVKDRVDEILKEGGAGVEDDKGISFLAKRPFKGPESFRKQKAFDDIMTAVEFGLRPISNNPIDLVMLKFAEMDRSIMANRAIQEWKKRGQVRFLRTGQPMPQGFAYIHDKYGTVYGPPELITQEYVDQNIYNALDQVTKNFKIWHERKPSAGPGKLGFEEFGGHHIVTQAATELGVMAHEIGHALDDKFNLWDRIVTRAEGLGKKGEVTKTASAKARSQIQNELRQLADLHWEGQKPSEHYKKKVRKKEEKIAHMVEAYVQMPERFMTVAPHVHAAFEKFLDEIPALKPLQDIQSGIAYKELTTKHRLPGYPIVGHWIAETPITEVLNNYLSSSLYNSPYFGKLYRAYMGAGNLLNQSQLSVFSAFHAGFTSSEVTVSAGAIIIKDLYGILRGNRDIGDVVKSTMRYPAAFIRTPIEGWRFLKEWASPTMDFPTDVPVGNFPDTPAVRIPMITKAAELAGGGFRMEHGLKTEWTEKMIREWYGGEKIKAALRSPVSLLEFSAKPILQWLVPKQKAGVFGELVGRVIDQNPDKTMEELSGDFRRIWNRVDSRLGQVRYDRVFMNNVAKNVIQGLIRAPGWTGGTIVELAGSLKDAGMFFKDWAKTGKPPEDIPDRVAYVISLLLTTALINGALTFLLTGEKPEGIDFLAFRTGGKDEKGRAERFLLPTYMKDVYSWLKHPTRTLVDKMHPLISLIRDILRNRDYYGVQTYSEDDNFFLRQLEKGWFAMKQFVPFWMRGAAKEVERGGGLKKTAKESPLSLIAPEFGVMPAPVSYTRTPFEEYASELTMQKRPAGSRTREQFEKGQLKGQLEMELRREEPEAKREVFEAKKEGKITTREAENILKRAKENPTKRAARSMSVDELAKGIEKATSEEKKILKPIFRDKIERKSGELDRETRKKYIEILKAM